MQLEVNFQQSLVKNLGSAEVFSDVRLQMLGALQSGGPKSPPSTWKFEDITIQLQKSSKIIVKTKDNRIC